MRILEQTPTQLTIQHRPLVNWIAGGFVAAFGLLAIGISVATKEKIHPMAIISVPAGLSVLCSPVVSCTFDRKKERLLLKRHSLIGTKLTEHSLQEITDVQAVTSGPYGIKMIVSGEDIPVNLDQVNFLSKDRKNQAIASNIRNFLNLEPKS